MAENNPVASSPLHHHILYELHLLYPVTFKYFNGEIRVINCIGGAIVHGGNVKHSIVFYRAFIQRFSHDPAHLFYAAGGGERA